VATTAVRAELEVVGCRPLPRRRRGHRGRASRRASRRATRRAPRPRPRAPRYG
jgi:hypothetical protein